MDKRVYDKYIINIVKQGNLSKAAVHMGISQPALSSGLTTLESELGFKIFNRRNVPITFTPEGKLYYDYIQKMQVLDDDFWQRLKCYQENVEEKVVVGGPIAYVETIVTDAVIRLRKEKPNYKVTIKCAQLAELIYMASKGEINCFVSTSEEIPNNFEKKLIKQEKMYLCIPCNNPINEQVKDYRVTPGQTGKSFNFSILNGEEFIFLEEEQPLFEYMDIFFKRNNVRPKNKITVNQVSTAANLAIKGEGICIASEYALASNMNLDKVYIYSLPNNILGRNIYVAYNKELFMPTACKELINYLENNND